MAIKSLAQTLKDLATGIKNTITGVTGSNATLTITKGNGTTSTVTVNNVANAGAATKATQDSDGQQINSTYIKGLSISGQTITYTKGNNTTGTITTRDTVYTHPNSGVTAGTYKSVTVNTQGHVTAGSNPTTLAGYGITDASPKGHTHSQYLTASSDLNVNKLKGVISLDNLPAGVLERLVKVTNDTARFALTTNDIQLGDTVKVESTKMMYIVKDTTKLNSEDGYEQYTAGMALSVPWSGVTGKPSSYTPSTHTHDDRYLQLSGGILKGNVELDQSSTYSIGSEDKKLKALYADEVHISQNTLYINETPVLGTESDTITVKADTDQSVLMKTSGIGVSQITSEKGVDVVTKGNNSSVTLTADGTNSSINLSATKNINITSENISIDGNTTVKNLNVTGTTTTVNSANLSVKDNIIEINSGETGNGVSKGSAGIKVNRGDELPYLIEFDETEDMFKVGMQDNLETIASQNYVNDIANSKSDIAHTHDDRYYTESEIDSKVNTINTNIGTKSDQTHTHDDRYYTESEMNTKLAGKSDTSHTHDDRYYTHNEIDSKINTINTSINNKSDKTHAHDDRYYTETEVNTKLATKSDNTHLHDDRYYTEAEIDSKVNTINSSIDTKADKTHTHDDRYYTESEIDSKLSTKSPLIGSTSLSKLSDDVTFGDGGAFSITQNDGSWWQRLRTNDNNDKTQKRLIYEESQGNSGSSYTELFSVDGNGNAYAGGTLLSKNGHTHDNRYYTEAEIDSKVNTINTNINNKSDKTHTHDDRYYTESEINTKLSGKSDTSHTHNYLPLAGGTTTGKVNMKSANLDNLPQIFRTDGVNFAGIRFQNTNGYLGAIGITGNVNNVAQRLGSDGNLYPILDSSNYNNYSPTKTGGGASGTWGINISGKANTAGTADMSKACSGNSATATKATQDSAGQQINTTYIKDLSVSGKTITYTKGNGTTGTITTQDTAYTHPNSGVTAGTYRSVTVNAQGHVTTGSNPTTLSGYGITDAPTKTGGGASGTWGINISGNSATSTKLNSRGRQTAITAREETGMYTHTVYNNGYPVSYGNVITVGGDGGGQLLLEWSGADKGIGHVFYRNRRDCIDSWSDWRMLAFANDNVASATKLATARNFKVNLASTGAASFNGTADATPGVTGTLPIANGGTGATTAAAARSNLGITCANIGAASASHTHGYVPLTGGTITGTLVINSPNVNNFNEGIRLTRAYNGWVGITFGSTGDAGRPEGGWFAATNPQGQFIISPDDSGNTNGLTLNKNGALLWRNTQISLNGHTHDYIPLTGGTITGQISKQNISTSWVSGRNIAPFRTIAASSPGDEQYVPVLSAKTYQGSWDIGSYTSNILHFSYITDVNFNAGNNTQTADIQFQTNGTVVAKNFSGAFNGINIKKDSNGNIVFS